MVNDLASPSAIPPAENIIGEIYCVSYFVKGSLKVVRATVQLTTDILQAMSILTEANHRALTYISIFRGFQRRRLD